MKFGFVLPFGDGRTAAESAKEAEQAGWDGFFVWEPVCGVDAWVSLTAAAMRTERIRLGTMLSPLSRMRPWKLASETATLDHLSGGRLILAVGLGAVESGFEAFGEVTDRKERAELLDEGLEILNRLWSGKPFTFEGKHYRVQLKEVTPLVGLKPPVQPSRIPIWVVGAWLRRKSMARALRYDGLLPNVMKADGNVRMGAPTPDEVRQMRAYVESELGAGRPYDIIVEGETPGDDQKKAAEIVGAYAEAGATWWLETMWAETKAEKVLQRIRQGSPIFTG